MSGIKRLQFGKGQHLEVRRLLEVNSSRGARATSAGPEAMDFRG